MISTVTTAVSAVVSTASASLLVSLSLSAVLTLVILLVVKQMVAAGHSFRISVVQRNLDIVILPLLLVFSFILFVTVLLAL